MKFKMKFLLNFMKKRCKALLHFIHIFGKQCVFLTLNDGTVKM